MLGAGQLDWSWWQNLAAIAGGLAILLVAIGISNRVQGLGSAAATAAANLLLLALIYAVLAYGFVASLRWVLARMASQARGALSLIAKAVPLLAIFALLSFTTQEAWRIFGEMALSLYFTVLALFVLLGSAFLAVRIPHEARRLEREVAADSPPLRRRQLVNVGLVMFVSQAVQVLVVSLIVGVFFVHFGLLAIDADLRTQWIGTAGNELLGFSLYGEQLQLTEELLRVAGGLAAFSGFYFAIAMLTDTTYRQEFLDELTGEMRRSFRDRAEYLRPRAKLGASA